MSSKLYYAFLILAFWQTAPNPNPPPPPTPPANINKLTVPVYQISWTTCPEKYTYNF